MVAQHIPHMINLEKLGVEILYYVDTTFGTLCRDLAHALQHFAGQHFREVRLEFSDDYTPHALLKEWSKELSGLGGETILDEEDDGHPHAAFKLLDQILTRENMAQMAVVFLAFSTERDNGDRFRLALQSKLPELYKHCVFEYKLWPFS